MNFGSPGARCSFTTARTTPRQRRMMNEMKANRKNSATPKDQPDGYVLETQAGHLLRRAQQRHQAIFYEHFNAHGLTAVKWAVLTKLRDEGEAPQNRLGRLAAIDPATMQGVVKGLADRKLITGRRDPTDGRRTLWRLSAAGRRLLRKLEPIAEDVTLRTLEPLTASQQRTFLALLDKLT